MVNNRLPKDINSEIINALERASANLLFMSESDYAFEVFLWERQDRESSRDLVVEQFLRHQGYSQTPEIIDLDKFFQIATTPQNWHNDEEKAIVERYIQLVHVLKTRLANIKVYRIGKIEIDIYIIGETPLGDLAGLVTKVVET